MDRLHVLPLRAVAAAALTLSLLLAMLGAVGASSHREAPLTSADPLVDNTDLYAFVSPDRPDTVTIIANWVPLQPPASGPNFFRFGEDIRYQINIDNDGDAQDDVVYEFAFTDTIRNPDTFLYNTGPITSLDDETWNQRQHYSVTRIADGERAVIATGLATPPVNVGARSTPDYPALANAAVHELADGTRVFAGQRDEAFYVDLGAIFDLGSLRPLNEAHLLPQPNAAGRDTTAGFNVHSIALQVPTASLVAGDPVLGIYSTTHRPAQKVFSAGAVENTGDLVQVSRLGMPLVNEVVVPVGTKDAFNASRPADDAQFLPAVQDPELAKLLPVLYPPFAAEGACLPSAPRDDLVAIFLTGIEGLNQPAGVAPSEMLRLNTSIPPTPFAQQDRMGLLAGQQDGFPNGRRLVDDTVDISLQAIAGATPLGACDGVAPNNALGDGVDANELPLLESFPYLPHPHAGSEASGVTGAESRFGVAGGTGTAVGGAQAAGGMRVPTGSVGAGFGGLAGGAGRASTPLVVLAALLVLGVSSGSAAALARRR